MLVVSDTWPLTALLQIGQAGLLPLLFARILIPPAVRAELLREHPILPAWLETQPPTSIPLPAKRGSIERWPLRIGTVTRDDPSEATPT